MSSTGGLGIHQALSLPAQACSSSPVLTPDGAAAELRRARFYSLGTDTRRDHYAEVSRWAPSWFPIPDEQLWLENVIHFQPLPYPTMAARLNAATEMMKNWEENCAPHHLAFVKVSTWRRVENVTSTAFRSINARAWILH